MTGLAFIDGSCARMIVDAARGMAASRSVVLRCHPGIAATFAILGADDVPGISLVSAHDR
jgi:anti-anti-sigma regulatory factor